MYLFVRGISFYDFSIECLEMSRHVVFFVFYFNTLYITILRAHPPFLVILCVSVSVFYKKASEIKHVNLIVDILVYDEFKICGTKSTFIERVKSPTA
jgi:hypothetical protein